MKEFRHHDIATGKMMATNPNHTFIKCAAVFSAICLNEFVGKQNKSIFIYGNHMVSSIHVGSWMKI